MVFEIYEKLPEEARRIREKVFMEEQKFKEEFDYIDTICTHIVAFLDGVPVGTCRYYRDDEKEAYVVGRLAVRKDYRGQRVGEKLLQKVEEQVAAQGGGTLCLHAQIRVKAFYEKQGYYGAGAIELEEYCPHIWMYKDIAWQN